MLVPRFELMMITVMREKKCSFSWILRTKSNGLLIHHVPIAQLSGGFEETVHFLGMRVCGRKIKIYIIVNATRRDKQRKQTMQNTQKKCNANRVKFKNRTVNGKLMQQNKYFFFVCFDSTWFDFCFICHTAHNSHSLSVVICVVLLLGSFYSALYYF